MDVSRKGVRVYLDKKQVVWAETEAKKKGISVSAVIRQMIDEKKVAK